MSVNLSFSGTLFGADYLKSADEEINMCTPVYHTVFAIIVKRYPTVAPFIRLKDAKRRDALVSPVHSLQLVVPR